MTCYITVPFLDKHLESFHAQAEKGLQSPYKVLRANKKAPYKSRPIDRIIP